MCGGDSVLLGNSEKRCKTCASELSHLRGEGAGSSREIKGWRATPGDVNSPELPACLSQAVQFCSGWGREPPAPELHTLAAGSKQKGSVCMGGAQRPTDADIKSTYFSFYTYSQDSHFRKASVTSSPLDITERHCYLWFIIFHLTYKLFLLLNHVLLFTEFYSDISNFTMPF